MQDEHRQELEDLASYFSGGEADNTDLRILYEVTGYQAESIDDWKSYDGKLNLLFGHASLQDEAPSARKPYEEVRHDDEEAWIY